MTNKFYYLLILFAAMCGSIRAAQPVGSAKMFSNSYTGYASAWSNFPGGVVISEYDPLIRQIASDKGYDWRFISAIAYAESRFNHDARSRAGAIGLMQVMPSVARGFKVAPADMYDPHTNVSMGVSLLDQISSMLRFPESISEDDRLSIVLASYNCGIGHVLDARRLAVKYGENHNSWSVVSKYLKLKSQPEYYNDEVVRCGAFYDNSQTLGFVSKVLRYYDSYCEIAML
jgi:membrane-bound lytic murein transglycosylase F